MSSLTPENQTPNRTNPDQSGINPAKSGKSRWLIGLIILLGGIILVEGGMIISLKRSAAAGATSSGSGAPASHPGLWQRILPSRWLPSAGSRERQVVPDDRIVLWESAQDIKAIHDRINRLFSALSTPHLPLHPLFSNPATIRNSTGPATDPMLQVQQEIDRIFASALNDMDVVSLPSRLEQSWAMCAVSSAMQVEDQGNQIVVQMSLPGLEASAIIINLQGQLLTISANSPANGPSQPASRNRADALRSRLETRIMLPEPVDAATAKATYREDILRIEIQKSADQEPLARTIKVI